MGSQTLALSWEADNDIDREERIAEICLDLSLPRQMPIKKFWMIGNQSDKILFNIEASDAMRSIERVVIDSHRAEGAIETHIS
jgi:hypothetical protein